MLVQHRGRQLECPAMPSRLRARRDQARSQEPGRRRSADHVQPSRKEEAAPAPLSPTAYRRSGSAGSNPSWVGVTGYRLQVAGYRLRSSPARESCLLFAICFLIAVRWCHELRPDRIRDRFLQNPVDFSIVFGSQFPSECFVHAF